MKIFAVIITALLTGGLLASETIKLTVSDIHCGGCLHMISKSLKEEASIKKVTGNFKEKTVTVETKENKTITDEVLKKRVKDAGYTVSKIERIPVKKRS